MKLIKKTAISILDAVTGAIFNSKNISDKEHNTYSANIIDGLLKPQAIIVTLSSDQTTTAKPEIIKFDRTIIKCGEELSIDKNKIVIGKNIKYIEVSLDVHLLWNSPTDAISCTLNKNSTEIMGTSSTKSSASSSAQMVIPSFIVAVSEGDTIYANYTSNTGHVLTNTRTYMTVKKIG